jgi:uncharacterized protein (DUF433 family)
MSRGLDLVGEAVAWGGDAGFFHFGWEVIVSVFSAVPMTPLVVRSDRPLLDEAQLAAVAFLARYGGRTLESYRADLRRAARSGCGSSVVVMDTAALIEMRDGVRGGKPCFVGTRIAVYDVLEYLAGGMTAGQIIDDFPELTDAHIRAALEFAASRERRLAESA